VGYINIHRRSPGPLRLGADLIPVHHAAFLFNSITTPFIILGFVQFPFYGFLLGKANVRGQLLRYLILISLVHALAAIASFVL
jgi:hypothetical protein